jgi:hypothetical protein
MRATFQAFFDMNKVDSICKSHGLEFRNRYLPYNCSRLFSV